MLLGKYFKNINSKYKNHYFSGVSFNSLTCKKNNIFFAIKGNSKDGNEFIKDAIKKGSKIIVSERKLHGIKNDILYIYTKNVRKLLAEISFKIFKKKPKNLIAVTGTNGKTSIANFYFQILNLNKKKVASIGTLGIQTNFNKLKVLNTTLDPISLGSNLTRLKNYKIDNVILEASSHGLKQNRLDGLKFDTGIFTNLSRDHLDYHKNFKNYLKAKLYLFQQLLKKKANIIADTTIPEFKKIKSLSSKKKLNLYELQGKKNNISIISHEYQDNKQLVKIEYKKKYYNFATDLIGKIQIKNILMAMIAAEKSNINFKKIILTIEKIKPVHGRFEKVGKIKNKSHVILDYAHTPDALEKCLYNIKEQFKDKRISIVFGCGGDRDKFKRQQMGKIANDFCHKIYVTDDNPRNENPKNIRASIKKRIDESKINEISNRELAIKKGVEDLTTGDILLVAGKGHEKIQDYGDYKKKFSDKYYILKYIKIKNKRLFKNLKLNILNEQSKNNISYKKKIRNASINSKEVKKNDIFFAIKGKKNDGHFFIREAFKKGASLVIVNKNSKLKNRLNQIKVDNTLDYLTKTSSIIRENSSGKIIAITGSCGKTTLKELLGKTLKNFCKVYYSPKSFNNKFGVPLSLFNLDQKDDFGIFEVGMDKKGEIDKLTKIIKPDIGVITNISHAHAKNFRNIEQIALAKAEIIKNIKTNGSLVLNADDKYYDLHKKIALKKRLKIYTFSIKKKNTNVYLNNIKKIKNKYVANIYINNLKKNFTINNNFENNIKNLLATITVISIFRNVDILNKNIFRNFKTPKGRGDISKININKKNIFLIDESYNSNPLSLRSAIDNFDQINVNSKRKHLILGDMLELGKHSKKLHIELSNIINNSSLKNINVFGKYIKETHKNIHKDKKGLILKETSQIINLIKNNINNNDYIMIKGSNSTGLHKLTNDLKIGKINAL